VSKGKQDRLSLVASLGLRMMVVCRRVLGMVRRIRLLGGSLIASRSNWCSHWRSIWSLNWTWDRSEASRRVWSTERLRRGVHRCAELSRMTCRRVVPSTRSGRGCWNWRNLIHWSWIKMGWGWLWNLIVTTWRRIAWSHLRSETTSRRLHSTTTCYWRLSNIDCTWIIRIKVGEVSHELRTLDSIHQRLGRTITCIRPNLF
jgi:hypothetical protein